MSRNRFPTAASGILALMLAGSGVAAAAPVESSTATPVQQARAQQLVRPIDRPCPAGTTNYPPPNQAYSCLSVYFDNANSGHPVGLRQGRAGGFGYLHALQDHNVDEETIGTVIVNSAAGIAQGNDRFLYGLEFRVADVGIIAVEVIEDRKPSGASPDNYALGVVTAYCKGYDKCPDGVNETIP